MKSSLVHYTADLISTNTTAAGAQQVQAFAGESKAKSYRLVETLSFVYLNADGTFSSVAGMIELLYETATGQGKNRVLLFRCATNDNSYIPLINGFCDEGLGRVVAGRTQVIINPNESLLIGVAGFPAGKQLIIRGRYWEADTADEILQYYNGLNLGS